MKLCKRCATTKSLDDFHRLSAAKDGRQAYCKACQKQQAAARYATDKARIDERNAAWAQANRDKRRAAWQRWIAENYDRKRRTNTEWQRANAERAAAKSREWAVKNKEHVRRMAHERYVNNPERWLEQQRRWRAANPTKSREYDFRRRALVRSAPGFSTPEQIAARVEFYGGHCWICGGDYAEIDHVKPLDKGGSNWPANLRPTCVRCNRSKGPKWEGVAWLRTLTA